MSHVLNLILRHFEGGGTLTKISAIAPPFATTNLGDKVFKLRREGHPIEKRWRETASGKRFAEYFLAKERS